MLGVFLTVVLLGSVVTAQEYEGECECSIWMQFDGLAHPPAGPLYPLPKPFNTSMVCGREVDCKKLCLEIFDVWEYEVESLNDTIPEGLLYEGEVWGEMLCRRSLQKYVDNGGVANRFPGASGDPLHSFQQIDGCWSWRPVAEGSYHVICCDEEGTYLPLDPACL